MELKLKRNYLTSDEMVFILKELNGKNSSVEREILKVGLVAQLLIDNLGEYDECNQIYDAIMQNGICFEDVVVNYNSIDKLYQEDHDVKEIVQEFVNEISTKIDEYAQSISLENFQSMIKELEGFSKDKDIIVKGVE